MNFDLPDERRALPKSEDLPLILAWIKPYHGEVVRCQGRPNCQNSAVLLVEFYEDTTSIKEEFLAHPERVEELEDRVWRKTVGEQMAGHYTVYEELPLCLRCELGPLLYFLGLTENRTLYNILEELVEEQGRFTLVTYHMLSYPKMGYVTPVTCSTPQEFVDFVSHTSAFQIQLGEERDT